MEMDYRYLPHLFPPSHIPTFFCLYCKSEDCQWRPTRGAPGGLLLHQYGQP